MNSKDYIIEKINLLGNKFKSLDFVYGFDHFDDTHTIEVSPDAIFENSDFQMLTNQIYSEFFELFPFEGIYFVDSDVVDKISNPFYSKNSECSFVEYFNTKIPFVNIEESTIQVNSQIKNDMVFSFSINQKISSLIINVIVAENDKCAFAA